MAQASDFESLRGVEYLEDAVSGLDIVDRE